MTEIYHSKQGMRIFSVVPIPHRTGNYLYFIKIGHGQVFKIGTTNNIMRRMKQHLKYFNKDIQILWISPSYSKYTALRIEDKQKEIWKTKKDWSYIRNDRFKIPPTEKEISIKIRKEYHINLV